MYKKKSKIAILLEISRAFDRDLLKGIMNYNNLYEKFHFFFSPPYYTNTKKGERLVQRIIDWKPDGILIREVPGIEKMKALNIPIIISPHDQPHVNHINIRGNGQELGRAVATYFISKGFNNFAFLGFENFHWSLERQAGYTSFLEQAGYLVNSFLYDNNTSLWEELPVLLVKWLRSMQTPCAIFTATDELSVQLIEATKELEAKVPDDFSIIGVDNDVMICEMSTPTLSSVDQDAVQAGFEAASALSRWIEFKERPTSDIMVDLGAIITRNSTNALAVNDESVRNALHFITNVAPHKDISVDDVIESTTLSRRVLEKKFRSILKTSILEEIKKKRIERIKFLLVNSDLSLKEISYELDFLNTGNITRYFKEYTGLNPLEYRKKTQKGAGF